MNLRLRTKQRDLGSYFSHKIIEARDAIEVKAKHNLKFGSTLKTNRKGETEVI